MRFNLAGKVLGLLVLGALLPLSCQNDDLQLESPVGQTHKVGICAGDVSTRTEMLENGLSAVWVPGDEISVWATNSAGHYTLSNQKFTTYGVEGPLGYFTSELNSPMPEDTYTYYCCYPAPSSVNGTKLTFPIPSVQDGKARNGEDIMVSNPVTGPRLNSINNDEPYNDVSLQMNRLTHHLRFWIPKGENHLGEDVQKIEITMPGNIVGTLYTDMTKPLSYKDLGNGSKTVTLDLDEPLQESDFADGQFAYAVIYPSGTEYVSSEYMYITVYGNSGKSTLDPIPLGGRTFLPGHSTPVRLLPKEPDIYCSIKLRTGRNNIGESLRNIRISSGGQTLFEFNNTTSAYHNVECLKEYQGSTGKTSFDAVINAIKSGSAVLNYETRSASVDIPMTTSMMTLSGNSAELALPDVPYLLYEDFNNAKAYAMNDGYAASTNSDTGTGGYSLNGYLPGAGWNASRFGLIENDCIRINCRFEGWAATFARYCGRLDTPAMKYLKPGATVKVALEFDRAFFVPTGYNMDDSANKHARYKIGYHTKSEDSAISGVNSNSIDGNATIVKTSGLYASENVGNMTHETLEISNVGNSTRIVFYVDTDRTKPDKTAFLGNNSCYYLYLDNIKVYIKD